MEKDKKIVKGRGAQFNTANRFLKATYGHFFDEGIDTVEEERLNTQFIEEFPKKIVNRVKSPDLGSVYSMNPYQGCEHGCIYCYARPTHEYWGYSTGLDFERKIIVKRNAAQLLEKQINTARWEVAPIMLSGNTDCYQPIERKLKLTRQLLEILLKYKHPVGIITKNSLVLRDLDLLLALHEKGLVHVNVSITTLNERLRQKMEPRTSTAKNRLRLIELLAQNQIPVNAMLAPIIPGLNSSEIPSLVQAIAQAGASSAAYTIVRLNGSLQALFKNWIQTTFPNKATKVIHQIEDCHGGQLNDHRFGKRMSGEGEIASAIQRLFQLSKKKYLSGKMMPPLQTKWFTRNTEQLRLF